MDPIANLAEQRALALLIEDNRLPEDELRSEAARLAELVLALDEWRERGGFDPYAARP